MPALVQPSGAWWIASIGAIIFALRDRPTPVPPPPLADVAALEEGAA
jgi:hypothetical protein